MPVTIHNHKNHYLLVFLFYIAGIFVLTDALSGIPDYVGIETERNPRRQQLRHQRQNSENGNEGPREELKTSKSLPSLSDTIELAHLSGLVYSFEHSNNCTDVSPSFNQQNTSSSDDYVCHLYTRTSLHTQVLILSSPSRQYVAVIYAGTDDFRNALTDGNIHTKPFGPADVNGTYPLSPAGVRVHAGFDNAVFKDELFNEVLNTVVAVKADHPEYKIWTTGHSLGAADSILTAVAFRLSPLISDSETIECINFGCPQTGNREWKAFVDTLPNLNIWRFVNGWDIVPRLPKLWFYHVGHTVQLDRESAKAYWLHYGNKELGCKGVPFGWNSYPFFLPPRSASSHLMQQYEKYLNDKSSKDDDRYYVNEFEHNKKSGNCNGEEYFQNNSIVGPDKYEDDDEFNYDIPPNFEMELSPEKSQKIAEQYAVEYLKLVSNLSAKGKWVEEENLLQLLDEYPLAEN